METMVENVESVVAPASAPSTAAPAGGSMMSPEAAAAPVSDWRQALPEDIREHRHLSEVKDVQTLAKNYLNAQQLIGKRFQDMSPEDMANYHAKIGVPEKPDAYKLLAPEGLQVDDQLKGWYSQIAHKTGLTQQQAEGIFSAWNELQGQSVAQVEQQKVEQRRVATEELQKEFGSAFPQRLEVARRAAHHFGGEALVERLEQSGLGDDPIVIKALVRAGMLMAEDKGVDVKQSSSFGTSPGEAQTMIKQRQSDPEFVKSYSDKRHPNHQKSLAEMQKLFQLAYPEG